jgi:hypothetical protein
MPSETPPSPQSVNAPGEHAGLVPAPGGSLGYEPFSLTELDSAIKDQTATLTQVVMARYLGKELPDRGSRAIYSERAGPLLEAYRSQSSHQGYWIQNFHLCSYVPAAVVLRPQRRYTPRLRKFLITILAGSPRRDSDDIDLVYLPEASHTTDAEIEAAIWKSNGPYLEATQRRGERQSFLIRTVYSLIVYLLSVADAQAISSGNDPEQITIARSRASNELDNLKKSIRNAAATDARQDYLLGMGTGIIFLIALVAILFQFTSGQPTIQSVLGVVAAGGLGATVSVMSRLTANRLKVDPGAGTALIRLAGGFRPVVGAIFGLALYIFIEAGLFPIKLTVTGQKLTYFYLGVAFLAGFSERLAQDAITKAGTVIGSNSSQEEPSGEKPS